jgi:hypothetical protein
MLSGMTPEQRAQPHLYALHIRELVSREERLATERSKLPSWQDTKHLLLNWAEELDREAREAVRG